jgi:cation diffusion facilitator family transporter
VTKQESKEPEKTTIVSIVANSLLLIVKLIGGTVGRSQALLADAINSLMDLVANAVVWMGCRIALKPPDKDHRYGHGHANTLAAVFVGLTLIIIGGFIAYQAIHVIIDGHYSVPTPLATIIAIATILTKEILYRWTIRIGRKYKNPAIIANAQDHRSDVYSSLGALVGILAAQIKWPLLDPIASIWIALLILKNAIVLMKENIHTLMSGSPDFESEKEVQETLQKVAGIKKVRDLKIRSMGTYLIVDVKIQVDRNLTVEQGHDIATESKRQLIMSGYNIHDVMVHVEPYLDN